MEKKLYRDEHHKMIGGVCAGLADYFNIDVTVVRLAFAFLLLAKGVGFIPYIILMIVLPKKPLLMNNPNFTPGVDYTVPPAQPCGQFNYVPPVKRPSSAGLIFGIVLIVLGSIFLLDNLNFLPDFDFERLWPVILVAVGCALIVTGKKSGPWKNKDWNTSGSQPVTDVPAEEKTGWNATESKDDQTNHNTSTL